MKKIIFALFMFITIMGLFSCNLYKSLDNNENNHEDFDYSEPKEIDFNIIYQNTNTDEDCSFLAENNSILINSLEEFNNSIISQIDIQGIDSNYFNKKILIICKFTFSTISHCIDINSITRNNDNLIVYYDILQTSLDSFLNEIIIVEIEKLCSIDIKCIKMHPNIKQILSVDQEDKIIKSCYDFFIKNGDDSVDMESIQIEYIYGDFFNKMIFKVKRGAFLSFTAVILGSITLTFPDSNTPLVWYNGLIYELNEAYNNGIVSDFDIQLLQILILEGE